MLIALLMAWICPTCGTPHTDGFEKCMKCGTPRA